MKKVIAMGGAGFIDYNLVDKLTSRGYQVTSLIQGLKKTFDYRKIKI